MLTAIVRFPLAPGMTLEDATAIFESTAPLYRKVPGLVRKYYLYQEEGYAGGVYLWKSRAEADQLYTDEWRQTIGDRYGTLPEVTYYETPVIVESELAANAATDPAE
jgi:hypothetical protein